MMKVYFKIVMLFFVFICIFVLVVCKGIDEKKEVNLVLENYKNE